MVKSYSKKGIIVTTPDGNYITDVKAVQKLIDGDKPFIRMNSFTRHTSEVRNDE